MREIYLSQDDILREQGYVHESELPDFTQVKDHLQGIIEAVYVTGDVAMLESCLDEVCHQFGVKIKDAIPAIVKKDKTLMGVYLDIQRSINEDLRK